MGKLNIDDVDDFATWLIKNADEVSGLSTHALKYAKYSKYVDDVTGIPDALAKNAKKLLSKTLSNSNYKFKPRKTSQPTHYMRNTALGAVVLGGAAGGGAYIGYNAGVNKEIPPKTMEQCEAEIGCFDCKGKTGDNGEKDTCSKKEKEKQLKAYNAAIAKLNKNKGGSGGTGGKDSSFWGFLESMLGINFDQIKNVLIIILVVIIGFIAFPILFGIISFITPSRRR